MCFCSIWTLFQWDLVWGSAALYHPSSGFKPGVGGKIRHPPPSCLVLHQTWSSSYVHIHLLWVTSASLVRRQSNQPDIGGYNYLSDEQTEHGVNDLISSHWDYWVKLPVAHRFSTESISPGFVQWKEQPFPPFALGTWWSVVNTRLETLLCHVRR